jgi:hypothetical protein
MLRKNGEDRFWKSSHFSPENKVAEVCGPISFRESHTGGKMS